MESKKFPTQQFYAISTIFEKKILTFNLHLLPNKMHDDFLGLCCITFQMSLIRGSKTLLTKRRPYYVKQDIIILTAALLLLELPSRGASRLNRAFPPPE